MQARDRQIACGSILLSDLPAPLLTRFLDASMVRSHDRGETIFLQGEPARTIYIVLDGWVKLYRISANGNEAVVAVFTRGQSFGEAVALRDDVYPVAAEAATDCRLLRIDASNLLRALRDAPEVAVAILSATFSHLHDLVGQVQQLKAQSGAQRVAEFLLELAPCENGRCAVTLPYEKLLIAGRLGMKPESLSRAFLRLRDIGVTVRQNTAEIDDVVALRNFAAEDPAQRWSRGQ